jgi:hypothetical protein
MLGGGGSSHSEYTRPISGNAASHKNDNCDDFFFETELQNIQSAIANYKIADQLNIVLDEIGAVSVVGGFGICGYITSIKSLQLISCIQKGKEFIAIILEIKTLYCRVKVIPIK